MGNETFLHKPLSDHIDLFYFDDKVHVAVDGKEVTWCTFLVTNISAPDQAIASIDDLPSASDSRKEDDILVESHITPEEQLNAHASNLQAWIEHDYDTHLLHSNIAFNLLRHLARVGDDKARRVLEGSIDERIHDGNSTTRIAIILDCHDILASSQIANLLADPNPLVREHVVKYCMTTPTILYSALHDLDPRVQDALYWHIEKTQKAIEGFNLCDLSSALVETMVNSENPWCRMLVACYKGLSAEIIEQLVQDQFDSVRATIAKHPNIFPISIVSLANDDKIIVQRAIADRLDLSDEIIDLLLASTDYDVRYNISKNIPRGLKMENLFKLSETDKVIENGLARNPNITKDDIERLIRSPNEATRGELADRSDLSNALIKRLSNDRYDIVRESISKNLITPPDVLENLANDPVLRVRKNVLFNPNTSFIAYIQLAKDPDRLIQGQAKIFLFFNDSANK